METYSVLCTWDSDPFCSVHFNSCFIFLLKKCYASQIELVICSSQYWSGLRNQVPLPVFVRVTVYSSVCLSGATPLKMDGYTVFIIHRGRRPRDIEWYSESYSQGSCWAFQLMTVLQMPTNSCVLHPFTHWFVSVDCFGQRQWAWGAIHHRQPLTKWNPKSVSFLMFRTPILSQPIFGPLFHVFLYPFFSVLHFHCFLMDAKA